LCGPHLHQECVSRHFGPMLFVTPHPLWVSLIAPSYGHKLVPQTNTSLFCTFLSSLVRTWEDFPINHPYRIAPDQARLTSEFFAVDLLENKIYLGGMSIVSILLSLELGCHILVCFSHVVRMPTR
jgi:hypothetical protein